jgi:ADP-heptose:LPS heptosyltransferase
MRHLLHLGHRFSGTTQMSDETSTNRSRVLVICPGALGDLICLRPALRVLARRYRGCSLELMARAELADFAVGRMGIARGHSIDRREVSLLFSPADDAAVQASEFFSAFSAIHSFFGFNDRRLREVLPLASGGQVFFHPFRPEAGGHVSDAYLEALGEPPAQIGRDGDADGVELLPGDLAEARQILTDLRIEAGGFFLLMPGSGSPAKNWPLENYLELARELGKSGRVLTVLGPAEKRLEDAFSGLDTVSHPPLGALAGLARLSNGFVGNDSGVSHLAAAAGGRGVVIFGPTDPVRWRPLGRVVVVARMPLRDLPSRQVADALQGLLRDAESSR